MRKVSRKYLDKVLIGCTTYENLLEQNFDNALTLKRHLDRVLAAYHNSKGETGGTLVGMDMKMAELLEVQ